MNRRRKSARPSDPAAIAARRVAERAAMHLRESLADRDPAQWGPNQAALDLPANAEVTAAGPPGRERRIQRKDVFDRFRDSGALSSGGFEALRRLQDDMAALHRAASGVSSYAPRIDRPLRPEGFTEARRLAGERIEAALSLTGAASARLLMAVCEPDAALGRAADWRAAVARESGERLADAQGAILRAACENLAGAYSRLDRERGRARHAAMASRGSLVS